MAVSVVGVATSGALVDEHPAMEKAWPGVVEALDLIGSAADPGPLLAGRQPVQRVAGG